MSARHLDITLTVNGERVVRRVAPRKRWSISCGKNWAHRIHVGCEHGVCGACTVRARWRIVRGCLTLAVQCDGAAVETIEGLSDSGESPTAGGVPGTQRAAMRLLHARHAARRQDLLRPRGARAARRSASISPAITAAAPATRRSSTRSKRSPHPARARR